MESMTDMLFPEPTKELPAGEIKFRLLEALRNGRLGEDERGPVMGYCAAVKAGRVPSPKLDGLARQMVQWLRFNHPDNDTVIDNDDKEEEQQEQDMWKEFL